MQFIVYTYIIPQQNCFKIKMYKNCQKYIICPTLWALRGEKKKAICRIETQVSFYKMKEDTRKPWSVKLLRGAEMVLGASGMWG